MPSTSIKRNVLCDPTLPVDHNVRRDLQVAQFNKLCMGANMVAAHEEIIDVSRPEMRLG
jgi:hypothetical protein